jgi:predicted dehydrogenase
VRIGVIGVKGIGQAHLWALHGVDGSDLVAVCDVDAAAAEKNGADHNAAVFTDTEALFASGDVDAVVIATPPGTHAPLVRSALAAGMHVYCEKPFTPTADEGYELARYAKAVERTLQVGFQFRFHLGYAAMKNAVASIAPVRRVNVTATNWFRADKYFTASPWRGTWRVAGGGVLMAQAVHQVDALINAVGMPASVTGRVRAALHDVEVEDDAFVEMEWANGARGVLVASLNEQAGVERFEIVGERGTVVLTDGYDVRVSRHDPVTDFVRTCDVEIFEEPPVWEIVDVPRAKSEWFDMMIAAHRDFAAAVAEQRPPSVDGVEGTKSVEFANAVYVSSLTGAPVELPLPAGSYGPVYEELAAGRSI